MNLLKYNRHWEKNFFYPYKKHRAIFHRLIDVAANRQIVQISGLRRTGKTTLLLQLINYFMDQRYDPFRLCYFTFDEERPTLEELLEEFSKQTHVNFNREKICFFLDEIQKLPDFQNQLKVYYDLYPNIKFIISGSTSLFIKRKSQESLAGRIQSFNLMPLSFQEYLDFTDNLDILEKPLLFQQEIKNQFEIYLNSQFIESIPLDVHSKREYFTGIIRKIIFEDIPSTFSISNPEALWQIVRMLAYQPGLIIDYRNLANDLGYSNKTISNYLYFLEESFLVKKLYNFSRNQITSEKKLKKYYLASTAFCWALTDFLDTGRQVENLIASLKNYQFFWRDAYHHEIDFISIENENILPIEIKYKNKIQPKDRKNMTIFLKKFSCQKGIIYTKNFEENRFSVGDSNLEIIEKPVFLLKA